MCWIKETNRVVNKETKIKCWFSSIIVSMLYKLYRENNHKERSKHCNKSWKKQNRLYKSYKLSAQI